MKTTAFLHFIRRPALLAACASLVGFSTSDTAAATEPTYDNYIDVAAGVSSRDLDKAAFQKGLQTSSNGSVGIEDLYLYKDLNDTTSMTLKGRAMAGDNDFLLDLTINREDVSYIKFGYKAYRVWFDGTGGYHTPTGYFKQLTDEAQHIDRGNLWFEAGFTPEDALNFVFRYDLFTRSGRKDSTSWGDTSLGRYVVPSFHKIEEKRHQATATLSQKRENDKWELGLRMDKGDYTNSRNINRRPGESTDRKVTEKEDRDYDLFQIRGLYTNQVTEQILLTTAVARTKIDTTLGGTRIAGGDYDAVYDPNFVNRQYRDEGFFDLTGHADMTQTVGTISAMYQVNKDWTVVPSLRFETVDTNSMAEFVETNFTSSRAPNNTELESESDKSWDTVSGTVEARYKGIENLALSFKAEWLNATGDLTEKEIDEPGTPAAAVTIDRDTNYDRTTQKYSVTANYYPMAGATLAVQYYFKARQNDSTSPRDSSVSSSDRYPAYITQQDFETNDFNARVSYRVSPTIRSVTRYDYQKSTIRSAEVGLNFAESAKMTSHIVAETLTINPTNSWYMQAMVNYVWDQLTTPASLQTGAALHQVTNSDANYMNLGLSSGFVLDDSSDLYIDYNHYRAINDFTDNWANSVAYGTKARTHQAGVTWFKRLSSRTAVTLRYAYAKGDDSVFAGLNDYEAHLLYGKVQYRF
ncbi:MAG: hypothetical protein K9N01_03485 [Cephaloticoccus sp.]|nr:hypothetical protein [Cephaloticoccus sp.]